jgi:hypothetical protein
MLRGARNTQGCVDLLESINTGTSHPAQALLLLDAQHTAPLAVAAAAPARTAFSRGVRNPHKTKEESDDFNLKIQNR